MLPLSFLLFLRFSLFCPFSFVLLFASYLLASVSVLCLPTIFCPACSFLKHLSPLSSVIYPFVICHVLLSSFLASVILGPIVPLLVSFYQPSSTTPPPPLPVPGSRASTTAPAILFWRQEWMLLVSGELWPALGQRWPQAAASGHLRTGEGRESAERGAWRREERGRWRVKVETRKKEGKKDRKQKG